MSTNPPITGFSLQADGQYCTFSLTPGMSWTLGPDNLVVVTPDGQSYTFGRAVADPALPAPNTVGCIEMDSPGVVETTDANGTKHWTVQAGAAVTMTPARLEWTGKPGDAPPVVTRQPGGQQMPGYFSDANRVDGA